MLTVIPHHRSNGHRNRRDCLASPAPADSNDEQFIQAISDDGIVKQEPAPAKSTKVKCYRCQHRQVVPLSQSTFVCEQCGENLKRRTTPAEGHIAESVLTAVSAKCSNQLS